MQARAGAENRSDYEASFHHHQLEREKVMDFRKGLEMWIVETPYQQLGSRSMFIAFIRFSSFFFNYNSSDLCRKTYRKRSISHLIIVPDFVAALHIYQRFCH